MFEEVEEMYITNREDEKKIEELSVKILDLLDGVYYDVAMMTLLRIGKHLGRTAVVNIKK